MIAPLVIVAVMLVTVGTHPPPKKTSSTPPVRLGPVLFPGEGEDSNTDGSERTPSHLTVECGRITLGENHKSCNNHCRLLREEYKGGECIEGRCHCKKEAEKVTCKESCPTRCNALGQEGWCVEGVCHCHDIELKCEYHETCTSHCLTLGHTDSLCHEGICRCGVIPKEPESHPTIKCAELVSVNDKRENHKELCIAHCRTLRESYRRGECDRGICRCST